MVKTLLVSAVLVAAARGAIIDGTYAFLIDQVADHPPVGAPSSSIPDSLYAPLAFPNACEVRIRADGDSVVIDPGGRVGVLDSTAANRTVFELTSFAGGRFAVRHDTLPWQAELTIYGSGVPVIMSERGSLLQATDPQHDVWFMGQWMIDQPAHALYERTIYGFGFDGSIQTVDRFPKDYATGTLCRGTTTCAFGDRWRSSGRDTLFVTMRCDDSVGREAAFTFRQTETQCTNPYIWCGVPHDQSVNGDTAWRHCAFDWRWTRCGSTVDCAPMSTAATRPAPRAWTPPRAARGIFTIDGKRIPGIRPSHGLRIEACRGLVVKVIRPE